MQKMNINLLLHELMDGKVTAAEEHDVHGPGATEAQARKTPRQSHSSAVHPTAISGQEDPAAPFNDPFFAVYFLAPPHTPAPVQAVEAAALLTLQKGPVQLPLQGENWERPRVELLPPHNPRGRRSSLLLLMGNGGKASIHLSRRAPARLGALPGVVLLTHHPSGQETEVAPARA